MKINRDLFCISLDLHYFCTQNERKSKKRHKMKKRSSNIMTLRIKVCLLMMCSMCMILAGCSSEDDSGVVAPLENNGATARMDSISYLPGDPAVFKFNYDSEYKVKNYWMEQGWSNYFGADSVVFSYQPTNRRLQPRFIFMAEE